MLIHYDDAFATMLLTLRLSQDNVVAPLTPREFHKVNKRIVYPGRLLGLSVDDVVRELGVGEAYAYRLVSLLSRMVPLSLLLEECQASGLEVIALCEEAYPMRLWTRLGQEAPPVLFACGDLELLKTRGAAAMGVSARRDFTGDAAEFAHLARENNVTVYTDGSAGLGEACWQAAAREGGKVISFLAEPLLDRAYQPGFAEMIASGNALALSAREPQAGFDRERARERGLCLCGLTDFAALYCLERTEGPLWDAASTALAVKSMPKLHVRGENALEGNTALISKGAIPFHATAELPFNRPEMPDGYQLSFLN